MRGRRFIGGALVLLVVGGSLAFAGCKAPAGHWEAGGVSLDFPAGWTSTPTEFAQVSWSPGRFIDRTVYSLCGLAGDKAGRRVELVRLDLTSGETLQSAFDGAYARLAEEYGSSFRKATNWTATVDGSPALVKSYEVPHGEPYNKCQDVWVESEGSLYVLAARGGTSDFDREVLPDFEAIVQSLRLGGGQ